MAKTPNLGLNLLNGADFVDYTALNTIFETLDELGLDYVVEQGVSGEWWYRKWKSGRAECGIDDHNAGDQEIIAWNWLWMSHFISISNWPVTFKGRPGFHVSVNWTGDNRGDVWATSEWTESGLKVALTTSSNNPVKQCHLSVYMHGVWK